MTEKTSITKRYSSNSQCHKKMRYPVQWMAEKDAVRLKEIEHIQHDLIVYKCPWCGAFHIGGLVA